MAKAVVTGDKELINALEHMRWASARKIMRPAISKGLTIANRAAKATVPRRSGALKKAIQKKVSKAKAGGVTGMVYVSSKQNTDDNKPTKYAHLVEFGTKDAAPRPFLRNAISDNKATIDRVIHKAAKAQLEKEAAKARLKGRSL